MISDKKKITFSIIILGLVLSSLSFATVAWFGSKNTVGTLDELGGSVLRSYFHSGSGTADDPFTITTPWHYENFVKLHDSMEGFAEQKYHFELGYPLNGGTQKYFYGTNENGVVNYDIKNSVTLNLGGEKFAPLGNEEKPFLGELNGNNLTVTNFNIDGNGCHDIGIFGYIGENSDGTGAFIHDVYFDNFTINTKGAVADDHHDDVEGRKHPENAHVGYIAGHVVRTQNITNVYVNNCTIDGQTAKDRTIDTYGYYGKAEYDTSGSGTKRGENYNFDLRAQDVYEALNENYNTIRENPLKTRVGKDEDNDGRHYADYDFPLPGESDWDNNQATHPLSEAISHSSTTTYTLNGVTTSQEVPAPRSYSLSSIGYQPLTEGRTEYEVSSSDSRYDATKTITTNKTAPALSNQPNAGDIFRYDSNEQLWYYQHSENDSTSYVPAKTFTFNLSTVQEFSVSESLGSSSPSMYDARAYFYIDGVEVYNKPVSNNIERVRSGLGYKYRLYNITLSQTSFTYNLQRGTHYYAFFLSFATVNNAMRFAYLEDEAKTKNTSGSNQTSTGTKVTMSGANAKNWSVAQGTFLIETDDYIRGTFSFNASKYDGSNCTVEDQNPTITVDKNKWDGVVPQYINPNSYEIPLYGLDRSNPHSQISPLKDGSIDHFTQETYLEKVYDEQTGQDIEVVRYIYVAANTPIRSPDYSKEPVYISDTESLVDNNYKYKNIDIVGGNVSFTYIQRILFVPINLSVINLPPETENTNIVEYPTTAEIDSESQFYATKYCPGSIVMYVNNSANAYDNVDSQIGHIDFKYANMNYQGQSLINLEEPSFKKGSGNFVNVRTLGRIEPGQGLEFVSTFTGDITESGAKKTSYCCLDKDGKMLGLYDSNGNPGYGFFKLATDEPASERYIYTSGTGGYANGTYTKSESGRYVLDKEKILRISTYVIVLGCSSTSSQRSTYITEISFDYKSIDGSSGSFGPVGYRSANDTIPDTILNFYFDIPGATTYSITVFFDRRDDTYYITFSADGDVTINIFNYRLDQYKVNFNGTVYTVETIVINYTP